MECQTGSHSLKRDLDDCMEEEDEVVHQLLISRDLFVECVDAWLDKNGADALVQCFSGSSNRKQAITPKKKPVLKKNEIPIECEMFESK